MKVYLNEITGLAPAMVSLLMSKRSWTREKEQQIYQLARTCTDERGAVRAGVPEEFIKKMESIITWGVYGVYDRSKINGHTTLLRYIDLCFTVEGLHRYGQDDLDSHAKRMDNRIVRSSTRLAKFSDGEKSDYYKGKILYPFEAFRQLGINIPETLIDDKGITYVLTDFGYVREDLKDNQDAKRGLYPGAIPSNFTFKIQYPEFCHIYNHRNSSGGANPEVKDCIELAALKIKFFNKWLYQAIPDVKMQGETPEEVRKRFQIELDKKEGK